MGETELVAAIRKGCNTAEIHMSCSYPDCGCKQMPTAIKAALEHAAAREARYIAALDRIAFCGAGEDYRALREFARVALSGGKP